MRTAVFALFCFTVAAQDLAPAKEAALGSELVRQVRRNTTPVESQAVQDYVSRLGARVAAGLPPGQFPLAFAVVNGLENPLHAPLVLPGGTVFVPLSLLAATDDEAELAGVLAQAIAHGPPVVSAGPGQIPLYFWGSLSDSVALPAPALEKWRAKELEADKSAVVAASAAGFDPAALLDYVEREQEPEPANVGPKFSGLPPLAQRSAALTRAIRELPPRASYIEDSSDFAAMRALAQAEMTPARPRPRPSLQRQP
jgi:predicted Zn-dependent protease